MTAYEERISDWSSYVCSSDLERGRQFDDTESRSQMPARRPHRRNHFGAQFVGELAEVFGLQLAEVGGDIHRVEQRRMRTIGHRAVIKITADSVERKGISRRPRPRAASPQDRKSKRLNSSH